MLVYGFKNQHSVLGVDVLTFFFFFEVLIWTQFVLDLLCSF
jgi:hypothetical protein